MRNPTSFLLLLLVAAVLHAEPSLEHARRARALLGPDTWSQLLRIENETRGGRYARVVHALVFEFQNILWFYTAAEGTQSLSLHRDNLAAEKADFGPLLRAIEPGFVRWTVLDIEDADAGELAREEPLLNGCFIESIAALRERLLRGLPTEEPRLLSYYAGSRSSRRGHTVLAYGAGERVEIFDPERPGERLTFSGALAPDPLALARALEGRHIVKARYVPVDLAASESTLLASSTSSRSPQPERDASRQRS